jgi:hypothetical protein
MQEEFKELMLLCQDRIHIEANPSQGAYRESRLAASDHFDWDSWSWATTGTTPTAGGKDLLYIDYFQGVYSCVLYCGIADKEWANMP